MWHIVKAVCILVIELNIYFFIGNAMSKIKFFPNAETCGWRLVYGFLGYHALFWCIAFPCTMGNMTLTSLTIIWGILLCALLAVSIWICSFSGLIKCYKDLFLMLIHDRLYMIPCLLLICFLIYYVCVNGQNDIDARFYIGEITTHLDTNRLAGEDVLAGYEVTDIGWKYAFSMIGANSAVLCKIFNIRPLVLCRTVRTAINIILLMAVSFEFFYWIYHEKKHQFEHSIMATTLSGAFLFLFANTIYTPSAFILHRTYEGKAYCGGVLVLLLINLIIKLCETKDSRHFLLIFICMLTGISLSASSVFLLPVLAGSMVLAYVLYSRRWKYLIMLVASLLPNILYCMIYIMKIPSFQLK